MSPPLGTRVSIDLTVEGQFHRCGGLGHPRLLTMHRPLLEWSSKAHQDQSNALTKVVMQMQREKLSDT